MPIAIKSPDVVTRLCPLGVRFRDDVTGAVVSDGLEVTACPKAAWMAAASPPLSSTGIGGVFPDVPPLQRRAAAPNRSGVFVFRSLPGLRAIEHGPGDDVFWEGPLGTTKHSFVVEVRDSLERYLPFTFEADLPTRGLFNLECDPMASPSGPQPVPAVAALAQAPLFSAPTRLVPAGLAALRADLWDLINDVPAAWAMLTVTIVDAIRGPLRGRGVADERGSVIVLFRYPEPIAGFPASPSSQTLPLLDQTWDVSLEAAYGRVGPRAGASDLCNILAQQIGPRATLLGDFATMTPLNQATLEYGHELILRSDHFPNSKLLLT